MTDQPDPGEPAAPVTDTTPAEPQIQLLIGLTEAQALADLLPNVSDKVLIGNTLRKMINNAVANAQAALAAVASAPTQPPEAPL